MAMGLGQEFRKIMGGKVRVVFVRSLFGSCYNNDFIAGIKPGLMIQHDWLVLLYIRKVSLL